MLRVESRDFNWGGQEGLHRGLSEGQTEVEGLQEGAFGGRQVTCQEFCLTG